MPGMTNLAHTWSEPDLYLVADEDLIHERRFSRPDRPNIRS